MGAIVTKWAQVFTDTAESDSYGLWIISNNGTVNLFSSLHQVGPREPTIQGGTIPLNSWTHVAMTFDGTSGAYRLYVNGQQVASQTSAGSLFPTNKNVLIGREDSYIGRAFDGLVDEASIFSRALSPVEIQAIVAAGTAGKCKGTSPPTGGGGSGTAGCPSGIGTSSTPGLPARPACAKLDTGNPLASNLAGLFLLNEGSGSATKNLATNGTATFAGASAPGWNTADPSVQFRGGAPGNSFLNAGTDAAFDRMPTGKFTIVAKINASDLTAPLGIGEKSDGNNVDGFIFGLQRNGNLMLTVEKSNTDMRVRASGDAVRAGQWVQVAVTWDGTVGTAEAAHLYVNGVEQAKSISNGGSGTLGFAAATNQPFRIGSASFDEFGSFNGKMAYVAVYNDRILTVAEMAQLDARLPIW